MKIVLERKSGLFNFEAVNEGGSVLALDASPAIGGEGKGFRPMETLLAGLGGCSGIDMVNMLKKQKEKIEGIRITLQASRREQEVPAIFDHIEIHFELHGQLNQQKVERALQLTFDKYCSVAKILSATATIKYTYSIINETAIATPAQSK